MNINYYVFFQKNPALINEIRQELRDECKNFGEVTKIMVFDVSNLIFFEGIST